MLGCNVFRRSESEAAFARRREQILTAAEHCFVKSGFHRTTIQNIAADAGMSVGNVYRYFASKDAVVEALVGRDQAKLVGDFDLLRTDDPMAAFASLMRRQTEAEGRASAILWLEIWAEAARNPTIAATTLAHEAVIAGLLTDFFARIIADRSRAGLPCASDPAELARLTMTLFCGLMVSQPLASQTEAAASVDRILSVVSSAVAGLAEAQLPAHRPIEVYA